MHLGIELGLNHDPTTQPIFDESECQLCICLWGIVLVHDCGTSLLLGHPLAIAPYDTNTPYPVQPKSTRPDLCEHFLPSHPIAEIQADTIQPAWTGDTTMRHATRIVKSMVESRHQLPEKYKRYLAGQQIGCWKKRRNSCTIFLCTSPQWSSSDTYRSLAKLHLRMSGWCSTCSRPSTGTVHTGTKFVIDAKLMVRKSSMGEH